MSQRLPLIAAAAASLAALAAAPAAMAQDESPWTGFYVGATLGADWGNTSPHVSATAANGSSIPQSDIDTLNALSINHENNTGFTGGIVGGYNHQSGHLLLGLETDFGLLDISQARSATFQSMQLINPPVTFTLAQKTNTDWLWTVRPRIGYAAGRWLIYGTGGLAMTDAKLTTSYSDTRTPANLLTMSSSKTKTGWTAGVGAAYALAANWSIKGEWLYNDFGSISTTAASSASFASFTSTSKVRAHIMRLGLAYRF